ncbi:MAG: four helix bundle protein [Ignavibacteriae bacterium]|nr:four helix bundle protein [Ignavibacteriota bacterium]MCB9209541.1 four helix bundle protein [Ignavibacteriales bacterium]MCB9258184.1 four helix bundle protein [Ignavibacteriales bacterium]
MEKSKKFEDLIVWQKSHQLVLSIYKMTKKFPKDELFGLTCQMRRASVSIPANIAEGYIKRGEKDKFRFLNISQGSLEELKYYLILSKDLDYVITDEIMSSANEVGKLLNGYINGIQNSNS